MNILNTTERNSISVWFVCKSCEFTFSFPTVDEFLEHKKQKHLVEFQKAQCIVFEERKQDEFFARTDEDEETKLFAQDDDEEDRYVIVELGSGSGTTELFKETAEEPPSPAPLPVTKPTSPPVPDKLSHSETAIESAAAALKEKSKHEYEFNGVFGAFSSRFNNLEDDPRDLEADLVQIDSTHTARSTQLVQSHVGVNNDSSDFSLENLDSDQDFNFADSDADSYDFNVKDVIDPLSDNLCDAPNNSTLPNTVNPLLPKHPDVLLRRLTAKELAFSSSNLVVSPIHNQPKIKLRTKKKKRKKGKNSTQTQEIGKPFLCTICSKPFSNKYARGLHIKAHYGPESGPRPISCSYPDCTASFRKPSELDKHTRRHRKAELNPNSKSMFSARNLIFRKPQNQAEIDSLTLREWLSEQKFQHEKSNSTQTETETKTDTGNLILLDPDLTEMDEIATEAFKISKETPIQCRLCSQNLESGAEVKLHATHCWLRNKLRHVYCLPCNKTLCSPHVLRKHTVKRHTLVRKKVKPLYPCPQFPYKSKSESYLSLHMESHISQEDRGRPWVCEICGLTYPQQHLLKNHLTIHGENPSPAVPAPLPVPKPTSPPVELSHSDTAIETTAAAALKEEKSKHESEFNGDFGAFSSCVNTSEDNPCDLQADLVQIDSTHAACSTQLVQSHGDVENDSSDFSPENLDSDPDFNFDDSDADSDDSNVKDVIDPLFENSMNKPNNSTLSNTLNPTLKNPFVLLRRLTAEELASSSSNLIVSSNDPPSKRKMKLRTQKKKRKKGKNPNLAKPSDNGGPFLCTICKNPFENKTLRGLHMRSHFENQSGPRPFNCSYPDCTSSFKQAYELEKHKARHEKGKLNPKLKSIVNKVFFCFPEIDPSDPLTLNSALALREWLCEQKKLSENSNSSQTETEIDPGNLIMLYPDLTAMDETTAEAFKINSETPVQCRLCGQNLESAAHVQVHATHCWIKNKRRHRYCFPCNKTLSSRKTMRKHITNKHSLDRKTQEYTCTLCPRKTRTEAHLRSHMKAHTRIKQPVRKAKTWVCEICGKAYSQQNLLINHQRTHGEETPFKCPHPGCGRAFKARPNLKSHLRNHIESKSFSCPKEGCSKSFKTKHELTIHLKRLSHLGVSRPGPRTNTKSWKCGHENCGEWYPDIPALNRHRISAHGVKTELPTFECHICGKTFTYKLSLTRHLWVHNNDSPFKCTYEGCGKTYKNQTTLAEHTYTHTGERPYQCDLCGKDYNAKSSLNRHLEWHQIDNLPFSCKQCEKSFKTVYNLKDHVNRIHKKNSNVKLQIEAGSLIEADLY